ncbi:MAG: 23S rRNA (adenine(2503)-C(2))-methyltransferase RlmN, partial [Bacteroidetes bacterium]|nr:23S rRNA (adenine(2503)-C(2))-methyltransferase RlmN [Bacteroidota bacterium]
DINDSEKDAQELAIFCRNFPVKINIIEYNNVEDSEFQSSTKEKTEEFVKFLESKNIIVNVRKSRGKDIDAACGQLANRVK